MRNLAFLLFIFSFLPYYPFQIEKSMEKENVLINSVQMKNHQEIKGLKMPENQIPEGINQNWYSEVQKNIEKEEYNITYQERIKILNGGSGYQAPNRAQGFRTYFTKEVIKVVPREEEPSWEWGLSLQNQTEDLKENVSIYVEENRLEFDRGWIKEWYINSSDGLEQGFTVPSRIQDDKSLKIDLKLLREFKGCIFRRRESG